MIPLSLEFDEYDIMGLHCVVEWIADNSSLPEQNLYDWSQL
jgi:hypothetical protein